MLYVAYVLVLSLFSILFCNRYVSEKESSHYRPCNSERSKSIRLWSEGNKEFGGSQKDELISGEVHGII